MGSWAPNPCLVLIIRQCRGVHGPSKPAPSLCPVFGPNCVIFVFGLCYMIFYAVSCAVLFCVLFYARCGRSAPAARALRAHAYVTSLRSVRALRARCGPFGPAAGPPGPLRALRARRALCLAACRCPATRLVLATCLPGYVFTRLLPSCFGWPDCCEQNSDWFLLSVIHVVLVQGPAEGFSFG